MFIACIIGFIATSIIFGSYAHVRYPHTSVYESSKAWIFRGDYSDDQSWTVVNEFPYVTVNSAGVKTLIGRSDTDRIKINVENPGKKTIHAEAAYDGEFLTLEIRPTNITFDISEIKFGITNWLEDIFTGNTDIIVTIGFPESIYNSVTINQGSGSMQINDLYSRHYDVNIGSGKCEFSRPASGDFKSDGFSLALGSGSAVFSGMESDYFDIDIGSGSFALDRLSGRGEIDMGSGKGSIFFCDKEITEDGSIKHKIDMGSGNLTLYYPEDGGVVLYSDISSGKIEIDAFDYKKTINQSNHDESNQFLMGNGAVNLNVDLGSGSITIKDTKSYSAPEIVSEFKVYPSSGNAAASSRMTVITGTETEISAEIIDNGELGVTGILFEGGSASGIEFPGFEINQAEPINENSTDTAGENTAESTSQAAA